MKGASRKRVSDAIKTEEGAIDEEDGLAPSKIRKIDMKKEKVVNAPKKRIKKEKNEYKSEAVIKSENKQSVVSWKVEEVISVNLDVAVWAAKNVVSLLDEGCTIPFIARYRKEQTGGMEVQKLRDSCAMLEDLR